MMMWAADVHAALAMAAAPTPTVTWKLVGQWQQAHPSVNEEDNHDAVLEQWFSIMVGGRDTLALVGIVSGDRKGAGRTAPQSVPRRLARLTCSCRG